jgi:hypothetical protein
MKVIAILFMCCLLFQSCFSYKPFNKTSKEVSVGEIYKFDLNNKKEFRAQIDSLDQNFLYAKKSKKSIQIPHSEIRAIETTKKSTRKTIGLISLITVGTGLIVAFFYTISNNGSNIDCCGDSPN